MNEIKFTRKQLYDLAWSESMLSLSRKFNISDVGLRKICKRMNIPTPPNGYWAKLKFGKRVVVQKLPEKNSGAEEVTLSLQKDENKLSKSRKELTALEEALKSNPRLRVRSPQKTVKTRFAYQNSQKNVNR